MQTTLDILGGISAADFLRDYWQKKPLLIRQALPGFEPPISIDELAGLACEEKVESRLVMERGPDQPWQLFTGPFEESFLTRLPESHWTLLVQAVDHLLPEVAELLQHFRFLPQWRLDDIMISYAPVGGSVGPHFDHYDVFLLQASGQRRWTLGQYCDETASLRSDTQLKLLTDFQANPQWDWVLQPGDLLYLPPALAHWGISESNDCTTWSVGFRGLSAEEMLCGASDFIGEHLTDDQRYKDPDLQPLRHPAEIDDAALGRVQALLQQALNQPELLSEWFGRAMTQTKYPDQLLPPDEPWQIADIYSLLDDQTDPDQPLLCVAEGSRLAFRITPTRHWLFVDGEAFEYPAELQDWMEHLCAERSYTAAFIAQTLQHEQARNLLLALLNQGSLYAADDWPDQ